MKRVQRDYDFPNLKGLVRTVIGECDMCIRSKATRHKPYGELQPVPLKDRAWKSVSMDFIVKLPPSTDPVTGIVYDSIMVCVEQLTKFAKFQPFKETMTAVQTAQLVDRTIFSQHGLPEELITDRDKLFTSHFWKSFTQQLGVQHKTSTAYHPQTDGRTERLNQVLEQYLRCYVNFEQDNWVSLLPGAEFAYNSLDNEDMKMSPFYTNYGYNL